jgi:hypothetical protein
MKMQDIWFLLLISVIVAQLRLVGDTQGVNNAKMAVVFKDKGNPAQLYQTTRYSGMLFFKPSTKIYLTPHNLVIYMT